VLSVDCPTSGQPTRHSLTRPVRSIFLPQGLITLLILTVCSILHAPQPKVGLGWYYNIKCAIPIVSNGGFPPVTGMHRRSHCPSRSLLQSRAPDASLPGPLDCVEVGPYLDDDTLSPSPSSNVGMNVETSVSSIVVAPTVLTDKNTCSPYSVPPYKTQAIDVLRDFLSPRNVSSCNPQMHTPNTLRSLYLSVKSRSQVSELDLSSILSFFGSLSVISEDHTKYSQHMHPLATRVDSKKTRTYWPLVQEIARDKERLGNGLSNQDRYWVLRSELARVKLFAVESLTICTITQSTLPLYSC
jgi:hypothetical protein